MGGVSSFGTRCKRAGARLHRILEPPEGANHLILGLHRKARIDPHPPPQHGLVFAIPPVDSTFNQMLKVLLTENGAAIIVIIFSGISLSIGFYLDV